MHVSVALRSQRNLVVSVAFEQLRSAYPQRPALPDLGGGAHQRRQMLRVLRSVKSRACKFADPGRHAQRLPRRQIERTAESEQLAIKSEQQFGGRQRLNLLRGNM